MPRRIYGITNGKQASLYIRGPSPSTSNTNKAGGLVSITSARSSPVAMHRPAMHCNAMQCIGDALQCIVMHCSPMHSLAMQLHSHAIALQCNRRLHCYAIALLCSRLSIALCIAMLLHSNASEMRCNAIALLCIVLGLFLCIALHAIAMPCICIASEMLCICIALQ